MLLKTLELFLPHVEDKEAQFSQFLNLSLLTMLSTLPDVLSAVF